MADAVQRPFAVFDIDGTLYRWQLFHALVEELITQGAIVDDNNILSKAQDKWRDRNLSFADYEHVMMRDIYFKNLSRISIDAFNKACQDVVAASVDRINKYTLSLLQKLKAEGYFIIAISGSQQELIDPFCAKYGFDTAIGVINEREGEHFTGKISRPTVGRKDEILKELVDKHDLTWQGSVAIGDSESDIDILKLVEKPTAFNPNQGLLERAKAEGWQIVVERKSIAYLMENRDETIVLADTIVY